MAHAFTISANAHRALTPAQTRSQSVPTSSAHVSMSQIGLASDLTRGSLSGVLRFRIILVLPYPVPK